MPISLDNFKDFAGWPRSGVQASDLHSGAFSRGYSDSTIQMFLDSATSIVRDMLAFAEDEALPDKPRMDQAIYTLTLFFIENRSTQEKVSDFDIEVIKTRQTSYWRDRLEPAVYRRVVGLINPWRKVAKFMPEVSA